MTYDNHIKTIGLYLGVPRATVEKYIPSIKGERSFTTLHTLCMISSFTGQTAQFHCDRLRTHNSRVQQRIKYLMSLGFVEYTDKWIYIPFLHAHRLDKGLKVSHKGEQMLHRLFEEIGMGKYSPEMGKPGATDREKKSPIRRGKVA